MNSNQEKFEYTHPLQLEDTEIHVREMLPYEEKERMAQDYVSNAMVFDEETGVAYAGYNAELIRAFLILVHYTDLDLTEYDNPQGRYEVYDALDTHGLWSEIYQIVNADMQAVDAICWRLEHSAKVNFERRHSMEYKLGKIFEGMLGTENLTESIARAEGLNSKLIDMLAAFQDKKPVPAAGGLRLDKKPST